MELIRGLHNLRARHRGSVITIGNYDGVHRGHQVMLAAVRAQSQQLGVPATVVTFEPMPREYFLGDAAPSRLMRLREKLDALAIYGVDRVVVLRFDDRLRSMSAAAFEEQLLIGGLGARHVVDRPRFPLLEQALGQPWRRCTRRAGAAGSRWRRSSRSRATANASAARSCAKRSAPASSIAPAGCSAVRIA